MLAISALLTPPDVFTQVMLAVPILILYEISILISRLVRKKSSSDEKMAEQDSLEVNSNTG